MRHNGSTTQLASTPTCLQGTGAIIECSFIWLSLQADHTEQAGLSVSSLKYSLGKAERANIQQVRHLASRSDLRPLASGSEGTRGKREHEFMYCLMPGSQMNRRRICDLRGL